MVFIIQQLSIIQQIGANRILFLFSQRVELFSRGNDTQFMLTAKRIASYDRVVDESPCWRDTIDSLRKFQSFQPLILRKFYKNEGILDYLDDMRWQMIFAICYIFIYLCKIFLILSNGISNQFDFCSFLGNSVSIIQYSYIIWNICV